MAVHLLKLSVSGTVIPVKMGICHQKRFVCESSRKPFQIADSVSRVDQQSLLSSLNQMHPGAAAPLLHIKAKMPYPLMSFIGVHQHVRILRKRLMLPGQKPSHPLICGSHIFFPFCHINIQAPSKSRPEANPDAGRL